MIVLLANNNKNLDIFQTLWSLIFTNIRWTDYFLEIFWSAVVATVGWFLRVKTQQTKTCSKLTIEPLKKGVECVQS